MIVNISSMLEFHMMIFSLLMVQILRKKLLMNSSKLLSHILPIPIMVLLPSIAKQVWEEQVL